VFTFDTLDTFFQTKKLHLISKVVSYKTDRYCYLYNDWLSS